MKRTGKLKLWIIIFVCLLSMNILTGCTSAYKNNDSDKMDLIDSGNEELTTVDVNEETMITYFEIEDFQSIVEGKSTFNDVYEVTKNGTMQITSYGGFCDYPKENGGYIRIKFHGKDLIVSSVEEMD